MSGVPTAGGAGMIFFVYLVEVLKVLYVTYY